MEKEIEVCNADFEGKTLRVAIAHNLGLARMLMEEMRMGRLEYQVIHITA